MKDQGEISGVDQDPRRPQLSRWVEYFPFGKPTPQTGSPLKGNPAFDPTSLTCNLFVGAIAPWKLVQEAGLLVEGYTSTPLA